MNPRSIVFLALTLAVASGDFLQCTPNTLGNLFSCTDAWCDGNCNAAGYAIGSTPTCTAFCSCSTVDGNAECRVIPPYNTNTAVYTPEWCIDTCNSGDCPTNICSERCECGVRERSWEAYSLDDFYYEDILDDLLDDPSAPLLSLYVGQIDFPITKEVVARVDTCGSDAIFQVQIVWKPDGVETLLNMLGVTIQQIDGLPNDLSQVTEAQLEDLYLSLLAGPLPEFIEEGDMEDFLDFLDSIVAGFQIGNCDDDRKQFEDLLFGGAVLDFEAQPGLHEITIIKAYYEDNCCKAGEKCKFFGDCTKQTGPNVAHSSTPLSLSCEESVEFPTLFDFGEYGDKQQKASAQKSTALPLNKVLALATSAAVRHADK